jgi:hypothetical protein
MSNLDTTEELIKSRGFIQVRFHPTQYDPNLISPTARCIEIVTASSISLRGWDYPHISHRDDEQSSRFKVAGDKVETWIDWGIHKEVHRFYRNGQFLSHLSLHPDWYRDDPRLAAYGQYNELKAGEILEPISAIFSLTEVYLFIKNLVEQDVYTSDLRIQISLHNTANRQLRFLEPGRYLLDHYICTQQSVQIADKVYSLEQLRENATSLAADDVQELFSQFQWTDASRALIEQEQQRLIARQF